MNHAMYFSNSFLKRAYLLFLFLFSTYCLKAQIWTELGGLNGLAANNMIESMCCDAAGNIYVGGQFTNANGKRFVAKWDGATWSELGGLNGLAASGNILDLCTDTLGNVYAVGSIGNSSLNNYVAKWDGTNWSELGGLNALSANQTINAISIDKNGYIYAGGNFTNASGKKYVAKWDGISWSEVGSLNPFLPNGGSILDICTDTLGNIYACGLLSTTPGSKCVAKWDGINWTELGGGNSLAANNTIQSIQADATGNLYAAGLFTNSSGKRYVAKWDGISWSEVGGLNALAANSYILNIHFDNTGKLYAVGAFTNGNSVGNGNRYVAEWNGNVWSEVGGLNGLAADDAIYRIISDHNGNLYSCGSFQNANGHNYVAKYSICRMYDTVTASIINGNNYVFHGDTLTIAGSYNDTLNASVTGCDSVVTLVLSVLPNGINDVELGNDIGIYPNPTKDIITITINNSKDKARFRIIDLTGNVIAEQVSESSKNTTIDLSKLGSGIYLVECQYPDKVFRSKVMKN